MLLARSNLGPGIRAIPAVACLSVSIITAATEAATVSQPSQSEVEAIYLFDFGKFARWSAGADQGPLSICVAGSPVFSTGLEKVVANESVDGRALAINRRHLVISSELLKLAVRVKGSQPEGSAQ